MASPTEAQGAASERAPLAVAAGLFAAGFLWQYACGLHRFTTALNYAYVGGYEIVHGRLPYRDFEFLTGPALCYIQALFFKLFGTSYAWGYVSHAALLNALAPVLIFHAMRRRLKDWRPAAMGAALTVVWFYSTFMATPWYDQEAQFFLIAALWLLEVRPDSAGRFLAGVMAATSFYCKQSHGAFGLVYFCLYLWLAQGFPAALEFTAGGTAGVLAWTVGCGVSGGWAAFYRDFFYLPLHSGRVGFTQAAAFKPVLVAVAALSLWWRPLRPYRLFSLPIAFSAAALAVQSKVFLVFLLPLVLWPLLQSEADRALLLALVLVQLDGRLTSNNEIKIFWPFLGIFFGWLAWRTPEDRLMRRWLWASWWLLLLWGARVSYYHKIKSPFPGTTFLFALFALALTAALLVERPRGPRRAAAVVLGLASAALFARGARAWRAHLSDPAFMAEYEATRPSRSLDEPALRHVMMNEPDARGVEETLAAIRALPPSRRPVFLYLEADILYPLLGQPLPRWWWFDPTLTFKPGDGTEDRIIALLEKERFGTWVFTPRLKHCIEMPRLDAWLQTHSKFEHDYDGYKFYAIEKADAED